MIDALRRDLALAIRGLLRAPGFATAAVLTLALGIGGTATMFTAVDAAFLHPLPYPESDRLAMAWQTRETRRHISVSMLDAVDWGKRNHAFAHLAAFYAGPVNVSTGGEPRRVTAGNVAQDFFNALGVQPRIGRTFSDAEMLPKGPPAVIVSDRLWRQAFGGAPRLEGHRLRIEGLDDPVIGVMPAGFDFPERSEIWFPLPTEDGTARSAHNYSVIGRLRPDVSMARAQADMDTVAASLARDYPQDETAYGVAVVPLRRDLLGATGPVLLLLLGAVSFVLLIACANVANLLLARSLARRGETTVRLALGAGRRALVRPFVLESLVLSLAGGGLGLGLAALASRFLAGLAPAQVLDPASFRLDGWVLLFTFLVALAVGLLCGLAPALRASRQDLRTALAVGGRGVAEGRRGMRVLIGAEVAIAFVLLVGAGLLLRSVWRLQEVEPGFQPHHVTLLNFAMGGLAGSKYDDPQWRSRFFSSLLDRAAALPAVRQAALINDPPLSGSSSDGTLELEDVAGEPSGQTRTAHYRLIGGDYFATLGIPVLRGRALAAADRADAPQVAVVNATLARDLGGPGKALGRRVRIPGMDGVEARATIVGVVGDVHHRGLALPPVPEIYFPLVQRPLRSDQMSLAVKSDEAPGQVEKALREAAHALDPGLPVDGGSMDGLLAADLAQGRFRARLLGGFAAVALALAGVGIFGVVSYAARRRYREVGIRMALGADRGTVRSLVMREGMTPVVLGMTVGIAAAFALSRLLASLLFEIDVADPATFLGVALLLGLAALLSTYLPAQWATHVDPVEALRAE
ncbi:MAG TPA: ABC transporter permease [Thermoanaerobaculia bacterium]|nr:ABC transporter permease [Thermoanaerobaculia bacterium]